MSFSGFCAEGIDLLQLNRLQNSKGFYEEHKSELKEKAILPFYELIEDITPDMLLIDSHFVTVPYRMVSRIRRDTRFTKDKSLYRANLWMFFRRPKLRFDEVPGYFLEVHPEYWSYGCFGASGKGEMAEIREMILKEDTNFLYARRAVEACKGMTLEGECFKRPKYPDAKPEYQTWLNRKFYVVSVTERDDFSALLDGSFVDPMVKRFQALKPFYDFLWIARDRVSQKRKEMNA